MRTMRCWLSVAGLLFLLGAGAAAPGDAAKRTAQLTQEMGKLVGTITMGPMSAAAVSGSDSELPVPGARVVISTLQGRELTSAVTDDRGAYSVTLPPGTYHVDVTSPPLGKSTKNLPATVTITRGKQTHLDIGLETGMR